MSKRIAGKRVAGKIFSTPEEARVTRPSDAELVELRKLFDEAQERIDRLNEADHWTEVSPKFWDDMSGTEYEGWRDR
jgi:hypothetical protein